MKLKIALLVGMLALPLSSAIAWDADDIQGKWVITATDGEDVGERTEMWEFRGDQWLAWTSGRALAPDTFTLVGDVIDLGYAKINVLEISDSVLKTEQMGFVYTLERE